MCTYYIYIYVDGYIYIYINIHIFCYVFAIHVKLHNNDSTTTFDKKHSLGSTGRIHMCIYIYICHVTSCHVKRG